MKFNIKHLNLFLVVVSILTVVLDFAFPMPGLPADMVTASVLGVLITGAAVQTTFSGQSQCDSYIVIGDADTACPISGITVEIDGTPFINIANSQPLVSAFMKWQMEFSATVVALMLKVSTGKIVKNTTYRFTNNGATTPTIRVFSDAQNGVPFVATTKGININSYEDFSKFSALFITASANVASVEIVFADGHKATMTIEEVDALFGLKYATQADCRLDAVVSTIDNSDQSIQSVRVFAGATAVTVLIVKIPDTAFKVLKGM